ncbi:MAG: hypothetical protein E7578_03995 [Ruminococcaceae bacterium]|nr:hypothetical protein [Oscillospiraceae bacterium]
MKKRIEKFIAKNGLSPKNILYIIRDQSKTCIHMAGGKEVSTYFSMKNLLSVLGDADIISINKGVAISCKEIVSIENGVYTMSDGMKLRGRVRTPGEHKRNNALVTAMRVSDHGTADITPENIVTSFSVLDNLPLAFGVFEIISDENGVPCDMVFRYLNNHMAILSGKDIEMCHGRSFYEVFGGNDKEWLQINADVAATGEQRVVKKYSSELSQHLSLFYFSPIPGFSACAFVLNES